ncbi:bifunctional diguanylate cyclase/phosphodiesterase [Colwellia ponticola]|uniref:bifunctional diguanylate cyclase/phosphodiesterase n=1 Tax=Colwellia ponticola TaxID=2304625 RepID=UPI0026AB576C|nr:EAL domain-containing protein [Colwellia ponticola]
MEADSRKTLFFSISLTVLCMVIVYYSFTTGRNIAERYFPLLDAAIEMKLEATKAHLWFEEIINGDNSVDIDSVWSHIEQSRWYAQAMLTGGINEESTYIALNDANLRANITKNLDDIDHIKHLAQIRWSSPTTSTAGSALDQELDLAFLQFNQSAKKVAIALKKLMAAELQVFKFTQQLLMFLTLLVGAGMSFLLVRGNKRQVANINALTQSEDAHKKSKTQLLNVINGAKLGYWDWNYKTGEQIVNDEWLAMLGLSRHDINNHISDWDKLIHPNDKTLAMDVVQQHIHTKENYVVEFRMQHSDDRWIWIQGSGSVVEYDEATQQPLRLCGTHQDITERKLSELRDKARTHVLELITSGESLSVVLTAIVNGIEQENPLMLCSVLLLDDEGKHLISGAAPSLPDFYNAAIDGVEIGMGVGSCGTAAFTNQRVVVEDIATHPYWAPFKAIANKAALGSCWSEPIRSTQGKVLGTLAIYHRNSHKPTEANISLIEQTAYLASIAIEQAHNHLALKNKELRFNQLLQSIPSVSVQGYDYEGNTRYWNKASEYLYGYTAEEAIGQSLYDLIIPAAMQVDVRNAMQQMLKSKQPIPSGELTLMTKQGTEVNVFSSHAYVHVPGQAPEMFCIDVDLTKHKLAEEKLKLAASVFTHAREGIIITDENATIIDVNQAFTNITGYTREQAIGHNPSMLNSDKQSPEFYEQLWRLLKEQGHWSGELWNTHQNGELYAVIETISAVRNESGDITNYVSLVNDITLMKKHQDQLEHIAHYDVLTNLPNRSLLADRLSQAMLQCGRYQTSLAVVFLDLDGFKSVNDTYGHAVGDELLIALSVRMKAVLREGDSLSRIGGDEFVAVLAGLTNVEDCEQIIERFLLAASDPVTVNNIMLNVSASIGVTLYPQDNVDADQLMRHADQAMYAAKEAGKNRYYIFDTAQDDAVKVRRESLEAIRNALDNEQFVLYYQPKVNMRTGVITGFEALIRWQHPQRGLLSPLEFLPIIENNPMIVDIGEWVIDTALAQISQWQAMAPNIPLSISVNIAAVQLQQADFANRLTLLLAAHPDVEPRYLELEVLETSAIDDVNHVSTIMNACVALGVTFALDDFGTGYSSLTYFRRLPVNLIKIDQSFVRDMLDDADDLAIVEGVIVLAKSFKRDVIAEGVETIEHGTALLQLGCDLAQGYGIARPMPASNIPTWVSEWKTDDNWQI